MHLWPYWLSGAGCLVGAGMGLYAMINPAWASRLVRLRDDPDRPGGFAEFRGTYGGLFFAGHALALCWLSLFLAEREDWAGFPTHWMALGAVGVCAVLWLGTAIGRLISILLDRTGGGFNLASVLFELALGLAIGAPLIARLLIGRA